MSSPDRLPSLPSPDAGPSDEAPGAASQRRFAVPLRLAPLGRTRAPRVPFVLAVGALALAGVVGLLLFNTSMQQASFAASSLERQATTLAAREQGLVMEIETMRDPQRVARAAREAGMVQGSQSCFLSLSDGRVSGPCAPAAGTDGQRIEPRPVPRPDVLTPEPRYVDPPAEQNQVGDTTRNPGPGAGGAARNGADAR